MRYLAWTLLWFAAALPSRAAAIAENFATDPVLRAWREFGDASLFQWNAANQHLEVTWDSSRTNSLFYRPLQTVLTKADDFSFGFDLRLHDIAIGVNTNKPYTFEIAIGLGRFSSLTNKNFFRGAGRDPDNGPRNLVEFDYFPDSGFGATVAPTVVSSNNVIGFSDNHPLELTPDDLFRVDMIYTASNQVLRTVVRRNGMTFGPIRDLSLVGFPDFRVDTFAVISYSDAMQSPPQFAGSILAHGTIDNVAWTVPDPPLIAFRGDFTNRGFGAEFDQTGFIVWKRRATFLTGRWSKRSRRLQTDRWFWRTLTFLRHAPFIAWSRIAHEQTARIYAG
jgi:hypothetical protein